MKQGYPLLCPMCKKGYLKYTWRGREYTWECENCHCAYLDKFVQERVKEGSIKKVVWNPSRRT